MVVAHTQFKTICDRIGDLCGLVSSSATDFDADNLDRPQLQIKRFVSLFNQAATRMMHKYFNKRTFTIDTVEDQDTYELAAETCLEYISYHSFRNLTSGVRLHFMDAQEFRDAYPTGAPETTGQPLIWIPKIGTTADGIDVPNRVQISPIPDGIYNLEYEAKVIATELMTATTKIVLPPWYDDVWIMGGFSMYRNNVPAGDWSGLVQAQLNQIHAATSAPMEKKSGLSYGGLQIGGPQAGGRGRFYNWNYW